MIYSDLGSFNNNRQQANDTCAINHIWSCCLSVRAKAYALTPLPSQLYPQQVYAILLKSCKQ